MGGHENGNFTLRVSSARPIRPASSLTRGDDDGERRASPDPDPDGGGDDGDDDDEGEADDYFREDDPDDWNEGADACDHARQANTIRSNRKRSDGGGDDDDSGDDDPGNGPGSDDAPGPSGPGSRGVFAPKKIKEAESI